MKIIHPKASTATMAKIALVWFLAVVLYISSILIVSRYLMQISNMPNKFKSLQKILDRFSILGKFQLLPNKNAQIALSLLVGFGLLNLTPMLMVMCASKAANAVPDSEADETLINFYIDVSMISLVILTLLSHLFLFLCLSIGCIASAYAFANSNIFTGAACLIFSALLVLGIAINKSDIKSQGGRYINKDSMVFFIYSSYPSFPSSTVINYVAVDRHDDDETNMSLTLWDTLKLCLTYRCIHDVSDYLRAQRENPLYEYRTSPSCQFDQPTVNYNDNDPIVASA